MGLRVNGDTSQAVIVASVDLHNIACDQNGSLPLIDAEHEATVHYIDDV